MPFRQRLRQAAGLLALVVVSTGLALAAIELLLRGNVIRNEYYSQNQVLGGQGRDGKLLFILGDSFMAPLVGGDLVDYLAPPLAPHGMRIRNSATAGTGPVEYLDRLRRQGARLHPDIVLLSWYVGNDLNNVGCGGNLDWRIQPRRAAPAWTRSYLVQFVMSRLRVMFPDRVIFQSATPHRSPGPRPEHRLLRVLAPPALSASVRPAGQEVDYDAMRRAGIAEEHIAAARAGSVNPWIVSLGAQYPDYYRDALLVRSDCARQAWADARRVLDLIVDEAAGAGASVLPVIFPHSFQVTRAHEALYRAWRLNVDEEMFATDRPQQLLREYFRSRGIEMLDLLPAFRGSGAMLYYDQDEHLNQRGQQLAAQLIASELLRRYGDGTRR